jgi:predicted nucleic acid-binding Zn ribbon protein
MAKKKAIPRGQQRQMRTQQIIMGIIGILIVLSMVISMIMRY